MRIVDILQESEESLSSANRAKSMDGVDDTGGVQHTRKDASSLVSLPTTGSDSSWSTPSLKRVISKWLVSVRKKRRRWESGSPANHVGGEEKGLEYFGTRAIVGKGREKEEGVCDPSPSTSLPSTGKASLPPEETEVTFYDRRKNSGADRDGDDLGNNSGGSAFNMAVGVGLIFLFAKVADEYNKMIELRKAMETVFIESKETTQRKDDQSCLTYHEQSVNNPSLTSSETSGDKISGNYITFSINRSHDGEHTSGSPLECARRSYFLEQPVNGRPMQIDHLEADLKSKLELLQVNMEETEDSSSFFQHKDEMAGGNNDFSTHENMNFLGNFDMECKNEEQDWEYNCGVCPYELERRLHELLEARQQKQIQELECALQDAERELQEKEMEIYWWRNKAELSHSKISRSC